MASPNRKKRNEGARTAKVQPRRPGRENLPRTRRGVQPAGLAAAPAAPSEADLRALAQRLAKVAVSGLSGEDQAVLETLGADPSPLGRALRALLGTVAKREQLLERRLLQEQAQLWGYIADLEDAGGRVPGTQGDRYRREQWKQLYRNLTELEGMTGISIWAPNASRTIADHFAKAAELGQLTSELQAPGVLVNVKLPHPSPLTRAETVAFIAEQNSPQTIRGAWDMLRRIGTENLPTRKEALAQKN